MPSRPDMILPRLRRVIFKAVGDGRPYPDHGYTTPRQWSKVAPRQVRLDELVTTKRTLDLTQLLSEDSTFYGDLFAHVVQWGTRCTSRTGSTAPYVRHSRSAPCCTRVSWSWRTEPCLGGPRPARGAPTWT